MDFMRFDFKLYKFFDGNVHYTLKDPMKKLFIIIKGIKKSQKITLS